MGQPGKSGGAAGSVSVVVPERPGRADTTLSGQLGRFSLVGILNTTVDLVVLGALRLLGVPLVFANLVSTATGMAFSFVANRRFVFRSDGNRKRQLILFLCGTLFGLHVLQTLALVLLTRVAPGPVDAAWSLGQALGASSPTAELLVRSAAAKGGATLVSLTWNFLFYRMVFRDRCASSSPMSAVAVPVGSGRSARFREALFLGRAVDEARRLLPSPEPERRHWLGVARRLLAAAEDAHTSAPAGAARAVASVELLRAALHATLLARRPQGGGELPSASVLWAGESEALGLGALDPAELEAARLAFVREGSLVGILGDDAIVLAGRFRLLAVTLLDGILAPRRRYRSLLLWRWGRIAGCSALLLGLIFSAVWAVSAKTDLLAGKSSRTSSLSGAFDARHMLFHTAEEQSPFVQIDLGRPATFSSLRVENRTDCCKDRAVPLVAEVSDDQRAWREVARRAHTFERWEPTFEPVRARYLRLRVPRKTILHLKRIEAYP